MDTDVINALLAQQRAIGHLLKHVKANVRSEDERGLRLR